MIITLQERDTITVPRELRRLLDLLTGDLLDARVEDGNLVLTAVAKAPRNLRLTATGEAKEAEAEADLRDGRRGRQPNGPREKLTSSLDADLAAWYKAQGEGTNSRASDD